MYHTNVPLRTKLGTPPRNYVLCTTEEEVNLVAYRNRPSGRSSSCACKQKPLWGVFQSQRPRGRVHKRAGFAHAKHQCQSVTHGLRRRGQTTPVVWPGCLPCLVSKPHCNDVQSVGQPAGKRSASKVDKQNVTSDLRTNQFASRLHSLWSSGQPGQSKQAWAPAPRRLVYLRSSWGWNRGPRHAGGQAESATERPECRMATHVTRVDTTSELSPCGV